MINISAIFDAFNLINSVMVPTGNLGIMRSQMPQIDGRHQGEFINWLKAQKIGVAKKSVPVGSLMLTQNEINKTKVFKLMQTYRSGELAKWAPVIISSDNFVIDGSHRFVAVYNVDKYANIDVIKVDKKAIELVQLCQNFDRVKYRNHSDGHVNPK